MNQTDVLFISNIGQWKQWNSDVGVVSNCMCFVIAHCSAQGGFQLEFVSISWVLNHMTYYKSSALIG